MDDPELGHGITETEKQDENLKEKRKKLQKCPRKDA
jgi:hypothetical protein